MGSVLARGIKDDFFAGVDHVLYPFCLVFMGCYFFLQFYTLTYLSSLVQIQLPCPIFGLRVESSAMIGPSLKGELRFFLLFEEIPA